MEIDTWKQFRKGRHKGGIPLLGELDKFKNPVLISGCQRSGTTMLSRIITRSEGMTDYWFGNDDELDAALILSGKVPHQPKGRYCFQTTYLNECYPEYFDHSNYRMIWVIRNPFSVVYSMMNNWGQYALNELFSTCASSALTGLDAKMFKVLGTKGLSTLKMASLAYNSKVSQIFEIQKRFENNRLLVIDYDDLVANKKMMLPWIYEFIALPFDHKYLANIHSKSLKKKINYQGKLFQ